MPAGCVQVMLHWLCPYALWSQGISFSQFCWHQQWHLAQNPELFQHYAEQTVHADCISFILVLSRHFCWHLLWYEVLFKQRPCHMLFRQCVSSVHLCGSLFSLLHLKLRSQTSGVWVCVASWLRPSTSDKQAEFSCSLAALLIPHSGLPLVHSFNSSSSHLVFWTSILDFSILGYTCF